MNKRILLIASLIISLPVYASCIATDAFNKPFHFKKIAKRIISLAPNVTEILFSVGAGSQVVGVLEGSDYPLEARKIRHIGSHRAIDVQKIIKLHPDLIITWGDTFSRQLVILRKLGIPIYTTNARQLEDIPIVMENIGCLAGRQEESLRESNHFLTELTKIRKRYASQKPLTVFFQVGAYPLVTVNKNSWINQIISMCGGQNVFADIPSITPEVSSMSLIEANPQVIISELPLQDWKKEGALSHIHAIKNNWIFTIHPDLIERPSPRLLKETEKVCKFLQTARAGEAEILAQQTNSLKKINA